jgi:hypothetical protein
MRKIMCAEKRELRNHLRYEIKRLRSYILLGIGGHKEIAYL